MIDDIGIYPGPIKGKYRRIKCIIIHNGVDTHIFINSDEILNNKSYDTNIK